MSRPCHENGHRSPPEDATYIVVPVVPCHWTARMSFGHTLKKLIIKLNDKLDDPNAKAWNPIITGRATLKEHWRWTELAAKREEWRKIIQRTDGWWERETEQAEAIAAARRERRRATVRNRTTRAPQADSGGYAAVPSPPPGDGSGSNARDERAAARDAAWE